GGDARTDVRNTDRLQVALHRPVFPARAVNQGKHDVRLRRAQPGLERELLVAQAALLAAVEDLRAALGTDEQAILGDADGDRPPALLCRRVGHGSGAEEGGLDV